MMLWIPPRHAPVPVVIHGAAVELSATRFSALPIASVQYYRGATPVFSRAMLGLSRPRWHLIERQAQFDTPVYFAREIVITLTADEVRDAL